MLGLFKYVCSKLNTGKLVYLCVTCKVVLFMYLSVLVVVLVVSALLNELVHYNNCQVVI